MNTLGYVKPEKYFWFRTGDCAKSLKELSDKLKIIDQNGFNYHVNNEKNDIASWVKEVIKNEKLANKLTNNLSKNDFVEIINNYINEILNHHGVKLPTLTNHLKKRRMVKIQELLEEINDKIVHHSDILDKYEKVREIYRKLEKDDKRDVYPGIVKTYNKMQELWSRINY